MGKCLLCQYGYPRMPNGGHLEVSERGQREVGQCTDPNPEPGAPKPDLFAAKLHEKALAIEAAAALTTARVRSHMEHSQPREPGEDRDD